MQNVKRNTTEERYGLKIMSFFKKVWSKIKDIWSKVCGFFKGVWQKVTGWIKEKTKDVKWKEVWDKCTTGILIFLMASPLLILGYIFLWFMLK